MKSLAVKSMAVLILLLLPLLTTGCVVAIGNEGEESVDERMDDLEKRMGVVEKRLGIPPAAKETPDPEAAE